MTTSEAEKEFEEWFNKDRCWQEAITGFEKDLLRQGYFATHSRQQEKIEKLKEGIRELLCNFSEYLPDHVIEGLDKLLDET